MSLTQEDLNALRPAIVTAVKEAVYGSGQMSIQLDSPSQKQFRKRLGNELPHVYAAIQQHIDESIGVRLRNLELAYRDIAQLCQTLMEMNAKAETPGLLVPDQKIVIPGRD